jgi:DNA-binding CsgD family transcriptional regulator
MEYLTEKEYLAEQLQNLCLIDKLLQKGGVDLGDLAEEVPGIFHTNLREDMSIDHLNSEGEEYMQLSKEEINEMGADFFIKFAHPYTRNVVGPRFQRFYDQADDHQVKADVQWILNPKTDDFETFFTASKPFKAKKLLLTSSNPIKNLGFVKKKISRIVGEEIYARAHFEQFQSLTKREIEVLTCIAKGETNKQIGERLYISTATVKQHRKRIKKKTECKNTVELLRFAQAFDLV